MTYEVTLEGQSRTVTVRADDEGWWITVDGGPERRWTGSRLGAAEWRFDDGSGGRTVGAWIDGAVADVVVAGHPMRGEVVDPRDAAFSLTSKDAEGRTSSPMPGVIVRVPVAVGETVREGQVLVVVEAMKMENEYKSAVDGVVSEVAVEPGQTVDSGALLVVVEPSGE
jgi:biotin carboxyl carrier protein